MMKCKYIVNVLVLMLIIFHPISASSDVLSILTRVENNIQQTESYLFSADPGAYLYTKVDFCINSELKEPNASALAPGKFYFKYEVFDPKGIIVYTYSTVKRDTPILPQVLEGRHYTSLYFFTVTGEYKLVSYFIEEYPSINRVLSVNTSKTFTIRSGTRSNTIVSVPQLIKPMDKAVVSEYPHFMWTPGQAGVFYNIYISESPDPEYDIYWKFEKLDDTQIIYPAYPALKPNIRYYWIVKMVDASGTPIGTNEGRSEIFSFSTTPIEEGGNIVLASPFDEEEIYNSIPTFKWTSSLSPNDDPEYEFLLAEGYRSNVVWTQSAGTVKSQYDLNAPPFKEDKVYYWWVIGKKKESKISYSSAASTFTYKRRVEKIDTFTDTAGKTLVAGIVMNHKRITLRDVTISFKKVSGSGGTTGEVFEISATSGDNGKFNLEDVPEGKYKIYAEKRYGDFFNNYEGEVEILPGIKNDVKIIMSDLSGRLEFIIKSEDGSPIENASITLNNKKYTWSARTDAFGKFTFVVPNGVYNYEVTRLPGYSRYYENQITVDGETPKEITLKKTQSGAINFSVLEGGTKKGLAGYSFDGAKQ